MKLFIICSDVPYRSDNQEGVNAVHIMLRQLLNSFSQLGHKIALQIIFNVYRKETSLSGSEGIELEALSREGIDALPPLQVLLSEQEPLNYSHFINKTLNRILAIKKLEEIYPAVILREELASRIDRSGASAVLIIWSPEGVAATYNYNLKVPRIAYHGDVDYVPAKCRSIDQKQISLENCRYGLRHFRQQLWTWSYFKLYQHYHLKLMRSLDVIANVTASNSDFYQRHGAKHSTYVRNTWKSTYRDGATPPKIITSCKIKIIGHVGHLGMTGSQYGLQLLLREVAPALKKMMGSIDYEIHIIGGGTLAPALSSLVEIDQKIILRGFVQKLEEELESCHVFLMLNNVGRYYAAYTRHLVAWSMGLCLIAHENSKKAIPEISHGQNALTGSSGREIAEMIRLAVTDHELNQRLRREGRRTYEQCFTPLIVANNIIKETERVVALKSGEKG